MCEYEKDEQITQLKCDDKHYFHSDCIIEWIKNGHNKCPLCREPIENIDQIKEAMQEGGEYESLLQSYHEQRRISCQHRSHEHE